MANMVSANAPIVSCGEETVAFGEEMDWVPAEERFIIGGDLNEHVGRSREVIERVHGG